MSPEDIKIAETYSDRLWNASNLVVATMFGLAFGVYAILAKSPELWPKVYTYRYVLAGVSIATNAALCFALWRLAVHELELAKLGTEKNAVFTTIRAAMWVRLVMMAVNTILYVAVLLGLEWNKGLNTNQLFL